MEESEVESEERPSSVLPQGPEATSTSSHAMGIGASSFIAEPLHLGNAILSASYVLPFFCRSSDMFSFCFLAGLTKVMEMPILGEKSAPVGLDLARVGLRAPPKGLLQVGASPSEHAPPVDGGLIGLV